MSVRVQRPPDLAETGTYTGDKQITGSLYVKGPHPRIDVRAAPYSADPTDVADATSAIQAAINAAIAVGNGNNKGCEVFLGHGSKYRITDTITVPRTGVQYGGVSLIGGSAWTTILDYQGPMDRPALYFDGQSYHHSGHFTVKGNGAVGTSTGIKVASSTGSGTQSTGGRFHPIIVDGFQIGLQIGLSSGIAVSETLFEYVKVSSCTSGVFCDSANTLNIIFEMLDTNGCGNGLLINTASSIHVLGGAAAQNTVADFNFHGSGGVYSLRNYRSEQANRFLVNTSGAYVLVDSCVATVSLNADDILVTADGSAGMTFLNCRLTGKVVGNNVLYTFDGCYTRGPQFVFPATGGGTLAGSTVAQRNSWLYNGADVPTYQGQHGLYQGQSDGTLKTILLANSNNVADLLSTVSVKAGAPSTSDIPDGLCAVFKDSGTGVVKLWANNGGSMVSVALS